MPVKMCFICDEPILRGEPRMYIDNLAVHEYCDIDGCGTSVCDTENCMWRWTTHAGGCVV